MRFHAAHRLLTSSVVLHAGDVLRGVTCTNFVYPTRALFGAVPPQRHVVSQHMLLPQHAALAHRTIDPYLDYTAFGTAPCPRPPARIGCA
jgi:hypothetical protein